MKNIEEKDIVEMYKRKFRNLPKITGINWNRPFPIDDMIKAIESGIPMPDEEEIEPGIEH